MLQYPAQASGMVHVAMAHDNRIESREPLFRQLRSYDAPAAVEERSRIAAAVNEDSAARIFQKYRLSCADVDHSKRDTLFSIHGDIVDPARHEAKKQKDCK